MNHSTIEVTASVQLSPKVKIQKMNLYLCLVDLTPGNLLSIRVIDMDGSKR